MESLLCSFLCFGLYSYDLWTMGNLARGPVKDLVTALLGLLLLTAYAGDWVMNLSGLFFLNKLALSWFNLSPEAYGMALELMVWFNAVSLILWPSSFTLPNILRAAGDAAFTMTVSVISMWVFRVAFCYLMVLKFHCGLLFIWMGMFLDWAMRSLFFCVRFVRGRWMEQKVI
jgi:Na+-driven multidrug efflux pump